jgi:DNA-binding NarL/FixJ family response regulator
VTRVNATAGSSAPARPFRRSAPRLARATVRVCIVYEHSLFAHGIKRVLEQQETLRTVGMIERPQLSLRELKRYRPDVVVVEGNGGMAILESLEGLIGVAVSLRGEDATIFTGLPIKVSGPDELASAIRAVARAPRRSAARRVTP